MTLTSLEGQTLGKYRILEPLGRGGMARVYRAYHSNLNRYVAVKVLRPDLVEEEEFIARFRREAQAVAALRHPNIIQVFDFDVQGEITYMVMELLEGDTLKTRLNDYRIRGEGMEWGEIVRVMLDVLSGLAYAHHEGMIHRDVKPANILLTKKGQAVIADFGIAQIVGGTRHTAAGALMGTLDYMAPEQGLEGKSDERSDIYSLGITFYEMLTQRTPFAADTPLAVLMKHLNDPLPLPRKIKPEIPKSLELVTLKSLSKHPEDRYQNAAEMARDLQKAAQKAGIEIPASISLPLSFTTEELPSESVVVLSGTQRKKITAVEFASDVTDAKLGEHLQDSLTEGLPEQQKTRGKLAKTILSPLGYLGIGNLIMITFSLLSRNWSMFTMGWPIELFLAGGTISLIMLNTQCPWLLIPAGILTGNGLLMAYCSITGRWNHWVFLWVLELWFIGVSIVLARWFAKSGEDGKRMVRLISWGIILSATAMSGLTATLALIKSILR